MKLKRIDITKLCLVYTLVVVSPGVMAASTSVKKVDTKSADAAAIKWSGEFQTTYATNLAKPDSVNYGAGVDFDATVAAKIDATTYSLNATATKAVSGERELDLNNAYLGAARSLYKFDDQFSLSGSAKVTIPLSEAAKDYQQLRTALAVTPKLNWKSDFGLSLSYALSGQVNFHKTKTSYTGASNYQYVIGNALAATYEFTSGLYVFGSATYSRLLTYEGNSKDSYKFLQLIGYPVADNMSLGVGHVMGGSPLAANGVETEVRFFDSRDSTVFGMFTVSF